MSTTFDRIVSLYERAGTLLAQETLTTAERAEFDRIRADLDSLWSVRRREIVFQTAGPPVLLGGGTEADQARAQRQIAHGIAPLPGGA